ncbi:hypothetical protein AVEN_109970-1 [Araneus ventricosus]|uniref:Uncharacterized protein n=1 Tax=Araneus ventricosus TaxID=182803 RepID=A0A4Y2QGU2_ARAVE|nr:hypothetical protein AVEN_109970-1 [Araneus ventricosus]
MFFGETPIQANGPYAPFGFESIEKQLWRNKQNDRPISDSEIKSVLSQLFKTDQWLSPAALLNDYKPNEGLKVTRLSNTTCCHDALVCSLRGPCACYVFQDSFVPSTVDSDATNMGAKLQVKTSSVMHRLSSWAFTIRLFYSIWTNRFVFHPFKPILVGGSFTKAPKCTNGIQ